MMENYAGWLTAAFGRLSPKEDPGQEGAFDYLAEQCLDMRQPLKGCQHSSAGLEPDPVTLTSLQDGHLLV